MSSGNIQDVLLTSSLAISDFHHSVYSVLYVRYIATFILGRKHQQLIGPYLVSHTETVTF